MHGHTVGSMIDGFLDEIRRRDHDRKAALESLHALITNHNMDPQDDDLMSIELWLSR